MDKNFSLKIIIFIKTKNRKVLQKAKAVSVRKFGGEITARSKSIYNYLKTELRHFSDPKLQTVIAKYSQFPCSINGSNSG